MIGAAGGVGGWEVSGASGVADPLGDTCPNPCPDLAVARRFLSLLDPDQNARWYFRTIPDGGGGKGRNYAGTLADVAIDLQVDNANGRGVFVVINAGGHKTADITRVRAVWADFDSPNLPRTMPLKPHIVVESSSGKYHAYWLVDGLPLDMFKSVQLAIATRCGSDPSVCDLPRVMRLPGFIHQKAGPVLTTIKTASFGTPSGRAAQ